MAKSIRKSAKATRSRSAGKSAPSRTTAARKPGKLAARAAPKTSKRVTKKAAKVKKAPAPRAKMAKPPVAKARAVAGTPRTAPSAGARLSLPKNQAGLGQRDILHFMDLLLAKRGELLGDMSSMEREAFRKGGGGNLSNMPIHMADMGTDNYEQEFTLGLMEKDRQRLREINAALAKIQDGSYGICEATGKPISKVRLEAQPWARYSIEYARQLEKRSGAA